jgi:signal transduction histidine kinase
MDRSTDPPDQRRDTFRLAHRHVAAGGHTPTSGLALYVSRALIEANGGRIHVRPRRGGGSEVVFTLPMFAVTD